MKDIIAQVWAYLDGKKTYIIAFLAGVYGLGIDQHLWTHQAWLDIVFSAGGIATLRHAIGDGTPPTTNAPTDAQKAEPPKV